MAYIPQAVMEEGSGEFMPLGLAYRTSAARRWEPVAGALVGGRKNSAIASGYAVRCLPAFAAALAEPLLHPLRLPGGPPRAVTCAGRAGGCARQCIRRAGAASCACR